MRRRSGHLPHLAPLCDFEVKVERLHRAAPAAPPDQPQVAKSHEHEVPNVPKRIHRSRTYWQGLWLLRAHRRGERF
jgi:hypothetical protein